MKETGKLVVLVCAVLAVAATFMMPWNRNRDEAVVTMVAGLEGQWVGRQAPPIALPTLKGEERTLNDYAGKVIFLNIWASFCEPCKKEMPSMESLVRTYEDRGLVMLAVSVDPDAADAQAFMTAFMQGQNSSMTVLHDPTSDVAASYGTELLPETYIIDRSGRVIARFVNAYDWSKPQVKELIEHLLHDEEGNVASRAWL